MPGPGLVATFVRELLTRQRRARETEPDLVMDDPDKVAAYTAAGREAGVMAPVYLFHGAQICDVIQPGDTVLDLGCGPATQLGLVARLNPDTRFIGVDLSAEMLGRARSYVDELGLQNVDFHESDVARLGAFADASVDAVVSTMALHHLPDVDTLERSFAEVARVLKPGGGVYLVDFGRLKSERSMHYFAHQYANRQPELFTLDYLYSLRAAFTLDDFQRAADRQLRERAVVRSTFMMPYMMAVKSASRQDPADEAVVQGLHGIRDGLQPHQRRDLADLHFFFRLGGLSNPLLA